MEILTKSAFVPQSKSMSRIFIKKVGEDYLLYGVGKCRICGQWIDWCGGKIRESNGIFDKNDILQAIKHKEAKECADPSVVRREQGGSSTCQDWQHIREGAQTERFLVGEEKRAKQAVHYEKVFKDLLKKKIIT